MGSGGEWGVGGGEGEGTGYWGRRGERGEWVVGRVRSGDWADSV